MDSADSHPPTAAMQMMHTRTARTPPGTSSSSSNPYRDQSMLRSARQVSALAQRRGVDGRMLNTNGREVPLIPTLRLRSVSAEGGGGGAGAGAAAPKGSTYTYTSLHVASTAPTTKATSTSKKTPRSGGSSGKKAVKKKSTRPSTLSPAAIMLRAMEVSAKELPVSMERENVVSVSTAAEVDLALKRSVVRSEQEKQSSEPRPARLPHDAQEQPEGTVTAPDVQQRQPLVAVNVTTAAKVATADVVDAAAPRKSPEVVRLTHVREADAARETEQRRVVSTKTTERKAKAEVKDPGSALMQRAAQLLWDDLAMDDAWIDHLLSASSPPRRSRSPSPAAPTPPPPCVPEAVAGLPKHQWMRPAPLIIANINNEW